MTCSKKFPRQVPNMTNWLTIRGGNIQRLCEYFAYFNEILKLNVSGNGIRGICESVMDSIIHADSIKLIDLSSNGITHLPKTFRHGHFERIWLSGNEFECNCDMLWMANWLANTTSPSGGHLIQDYNKVTCNNNKYKGMPISALNATYMNCLPSKMPVWGIGLISGAVALIVTIDITTAVVVKRWNEVKFFMFMRFNILDKNDDDLDKLDGVQFDALLSYT